MNIQELLTNLHQQMKSDYRIADALNISQPTAFRLRTGRTKTSYETALKIIELAKQNGITDDQAGA